ncbi:RluA family pseudouridine synthase [uncultured Castellaniella sp.]|uniref:RluA family pseudouridine synthase n=1 Tax=uncultured Castellaniella sp. TaxID=647907 RepID=UPI002632D6E6|nr:RluA family pseudouridine synthase [uncultured Castellaniella sp.]
MSDTEIATEDAGPDEPVLFELPLQALPDRLDKVLARLLPQHSRSRLQTWIEDGHVRVDGEVGKVRSRVGPGARIQVWPQQAPEDLAFVPEPVAFDVVEDSPDWIVVNKPAGLVTHPGAGNWHGTLLNGLLYRYPELLHVARAGIVHRLDKDTSGLLVVARTEIAQTALVRQLQARTVKREYCALVHGILAGRGTVDAAIGRDARVPVRMSAERPIAAKPAVTHYAAQRAGHCGDQPVSEVLCRLETGRTHQIRVHMALLKHPLLGDALYGGRPVAGAVRQMLHARALSFQDPTTGLLPSFTAELPEDFRAAQAQVTWDGESHDAHS